MLVRMLIDYLNVAMGRAKYELLKGERQYYGSIPGFRGVYATGKTLETCRRLLLEILEEWLFIRLRRNLSIPVVRGASLNIKNMRRFVECQV